MYRDQEKRNSSPCQFTDFKSGKLELNIEHYKSDFRYNMEMFMEAAQHPTEENIHLLWLSRYCGTECLRERDAYLKESQASHTGAFHATARDSILAYAVEITGLQDGSVRTTRG